MTAAWIAILYAPISDAIKASLFEFGSWVFIGLCVLIGLLAFFKPRHLVYGEAGHRAERKFELGTETKTYNEEELGKLERGYNSKQIGPGDE